MSGEPVRRRIARWRGQIAELGATIGQLGQSGLDSATAQLLIAQARRIGESGGSGEAMTQAFDGEPFDPHDKGGGSKWMFWYKGRAARRKRGPYDFKSRGELEAHRVRARRGPTTGSDR